MAHVKNTDDSIEWYATELLDSNGERHSTWLKEGHYVPKFDVIDVKLLD